MRAQQGQQINPYLCATGRNMCRHKALENMLQWVTRHTKEGESETLHTALMNQKRKGFS